MDIIEIVTLLGGGGGLYALLTIPHQIKKAKAEANKEAAEAENSAIQNFKDITGELKEEMAQLKEEVKDYKKENKKQFDSIMRAVGCRILAQNPDEQCPVLDNFHKNTDE